VTSPFSGTVAERLVSYGEAVVKGQPLLRMDAGEVQVKLREATMTFIKAEENLKQIESWESGNEVSRARRSLVKTRMALDAQRQTVTEVQTLLKKGIVPQSEYDNAEKQLESMQMDLDSAQEEMTSILAKGGPNARRVAELELANARRRKDELERQAAGAVVVSPVSGTVIVAEGEGGKEKGTKQVERGVSSTEGEVLLSIGDTEGLSAAVKVDEMEVVKVHQGQEAIISGEAFPEVRLAGKVASVSTQAAAGVERSSKPTFEVVVTVDRLSPSEREKVRLGMTAKIEIGVSERPEALMVPIAAVRLRGEERLVQVKDRATGEVRTVAVRTGITTPDGVEILQGLAPGDEVVWSDGDSHPR
jgi:HlyD family secretion protein